MIIYLDKNKKPNVVCDGDNVLTDILEGENIIIERDFENKKITISSDARKDIMENIKAGSNISVTCDNDKGTITISSDAKNDVFNSIRAGENVTISHDKTNKTITINSDAKNETMNSIKAGDNIVISDDGTGGVTVNTLIDILDKNPKSPKPGYMWILNNGGKNPGGAGVDSGSGSTGEETDSNETVKDGTFACFDEAGSFYCSEDNGISWQKRGNIECSSGVYPYAGIVPGGNTVVTAADTQLYYPDDGGHTWKQCTQSVYTHIRDIKYINGKFYACSGAATNHSPAPAVLLVSNNGITWKTALQKYNTSLFIFEKIQYINNMYFLFAAQVPEGGSKILYSTNGSTWNEASGIGFPVFPGIIYNGTFYISVNSSTFETYTSPDGRTWTATGERIITKETGSLAYLAGLEEIGGIYYAVYSHTGQEEIFDKAVTSPDGIKWGDSSTGGTTVIIPIDISRGFQRHNGRTYNLSVNGTLKSSETFAPWATDGTVPLENPVNFPVCCFRVHDETFVFTVL